MLWVNLIMDTFAALALATETPEDDILDRQPYRKDAAIVTPVMWRNVFGHTFYQVIVIVVVIFAGQNRLCYPYDQLTVADGMINPFYTNAHYETQATINAWNAKDYKN
jgi:magnesium-transporting ATPase (P-type)